MEFVCLFLFNLKKGFRENIFRCYETVMWWEFGYDTLIRNGGELKMRTGAGERKQLIISSGDCDGMTDMQTNGFILPFF